MNNEKTRASLMGIVAAYLLYLAYELYQGRSDPESGMSPAALVFFIALFVIASLALIVYAVHLWKSAPKKGEEPPRDQDQDDSMK